MSAIGFSPASSSADFRSSSTIVLTFFCMNFKNIYLNFDCKKKKSAVRISSLESRIEILERTLKESEAVIRNYQARQSRQTAAPVKKLGKTRYHKL
jgi:hypothetical protein